jgi:hypothetical protein
MKLKGKMALLCSKLIEFSEALKKGEFDRRTSNIEIRRNCKNDITMKKKML